MSLVENPTTSCVFCGSSVRQEITQMKLRTPECLYHFTVDITIFKSYLKLWLDKDNTIEESKRLELLEQVSTSQNSVFFPMFLRATTYKVYWSASLLETEYRKYRSVVNHSKRGPLIEEKVDTWKVNNGVTMVDATSLKYSGDFNLPIKEQLRDVEEYFFSNDLIDFNFEAVVDHRFLESVFKEEDSLVIYQPDETDFRHAIKRRIPGSKVKNITWDLEESESDVVSVYCPFWIFRYSNAGDEHLFLMDGTNTDNIICTEQRELTEILDDLKSSDAESSVKGDKDWDKIVQRIIFGCLMVAFAIAFFVCGFMEEV